MKFVAHVEVWLRPGIADPEGATIERAITALGVPGVAGVSAGRAFRFSVEAPDPDAARAVAQDLSHRLLANPVIHQATVSLETLPGSQPPGGSLAAQPSGEPSSESSAIPESPV